MKIRYDFSKDTIEVDNRSFDLKPYRKWLIDNHESMVQRHYIRAIKTQSGLKYTFDWAHIYFLASEYGFLQEYIKTIQ